MIKIILAAALLGSTLASAQTRAGDPFLALFLSSASPTIATGYTVEENGYNKQVLAMAQEDAVKFVATNGKGNVSAALRTAIDEVNAKLTKAGYAALSDNDVANMVVLVNSINNKK